MSVMDGDGQEMEVIDSGLTTDADVDADIAVRSFHVSFHVEHDRERPSLLQKLHNAL